MEKQILKAKIRKILGRKVKKVRQEGLLPANIYGKKIKSQAVEVSLEDFKNVYKKVGETGLVEIDLDGDKRPVLIHNVQLHPVSDATLHADFFQVDLKEKVTAQVPVELVGESPTEKSGAGTVVQHINEITVEALPADLPEKFQVDASALIEVDQVVLVKDLKYNKDKVEVKTNENEIIIKVEPFKKIKIEEAPAAPVEGPASAEATTGEEVPAEGTVSPEVPPVEEKPQK